MQRQVSATPSLHFGQLGTVRLEQNYCRLCCYYYYYCRRCFCRKRCLHRRPQRYPACFIRPDDDDVVVVVADSRTKSAGWLAGRSVGRPTYQAQAKTMPKSIALPCRLTATAVQAAVILQQPPVYKNSGGSFHIRRQDPVLNELWG